MSRIHSLRRAARAARGVSLPLSVAAAVLSVLAPAAAHAQPACVAGTLAHYVQPGFACQLGGFAFDGFRALLFTDATEGVFTFVTPADLSTVLPFTRLEANGDVAVGFEFLDLVASVGVTASQRGEERGLAVAQVEFLAHALASDVRVRGARAALAAGVEGTVPGTTFSEALGFAQVHDITTGTECLHAEVSSPALGFRSEDVAGTCGSASARELSALVAGVARIDRDGDDRPATLFGFAAGGASSVTFVTTQVVPEPSTAALALTGLVALGGASLRGRARTRRRDRSGG